VRANSHTANDRRLIRSPMFNKPKRFQFVQEAAAQILDLAMPSGCAVTICARRGGLACAGSVWRHALQVSDDRNVEGEDWLSHGATMKRLELTIGDLPKVLDAVDMEADWSLEEPEQATTPLPSPGM
jgi:hypothetical protein